MRAYAAVAACLMACSSNAPKVGPTSGVDPGDDASPRTLTDLTDAEREQLCTWTVEAGGGYDASLVCDSGLVVSNFSNLQQCLDAFLGACSTVTVTEWEQCRDKDASDPCAESLYTAPECAEVARCLGETAP
ncbi:MAG TPA: hypothetical protein VGH28_14480 [Polyangiaceae bacterium]|jgi:hypothetical protein